MSGRDENEAEAMTRAAHDTPGEARYVQRFPRDFRVMHGLLMLSFLGLAATGLPLLFSETRWAAALARLFGGFVVAGTLHRVFASLLIGLFTVHVWQLLHRVFVRGEYGILWGPASIVPQPRDVVELVEHVRWFFGLGPRPRFDHFTYWEKFDYWAVFWGMAIIGTSGLLLWFPEFFGRILPGWVFNVAMLVHGEEALLAVGFIFTIHFFNSHLRPDKFPMDLVIFTGRVREAEFRAERPAEYDRLVASGRYEASLVGPPSDALVRAGRAIGLVAVTIGLTLVALIVYALLTS
jgi:cytochrome b subunit of formate dehydrogenase